MNRTPAIATQSACTPPAQVKKADETPTLERDQTLAHMAHCRISVADLAEMIDYREWYVAEVLSGKRERWPVKKAINQFFGRQFFNRPNYSNTARAKSQ